MSTIDLSHPNPEKHARTMAVHLQVLVVAACPLLAACLWILASGENLLFRYNAALTFLGTVALLSWFLPLLRGRAIGYPLQAISLIWFVIYGVGTKTWVLNSPEHALTIVYSSGFALIALFFGYILGYGLRSNEPQKLISINLGSLRRRTLLFVFLSALASFYFIAVGGFPAFHPNALIYRFEVRQQVSSYVVFMLRSTQLPLYVLWAVYHLGYISHTFKSRFFVYGAVALVLFINFIPGWRNPLMFVAFNLIFIYVFIGPNRGKFLAATAGVGAAVLILVMGFVRLLRLSETQAVGSITYFSRFTTDPLELFFLWASAQFSNYTLGFLTSLSVFPNLVDHLNGGVLVTTLATMLPGHQELLDEKLKRWSGMDFEGGGLNLTILGEAYADFGYFGLGLYPLIYGVLLGILIRRVETCPTPARAVLAAFVASSLCLGSLTGLLALSIFWVLGGFLVYIVLGEKSVVRAAP